MTETEGRVYNVAGQDWDEVVAAADEAGDRPGEERMVVNMGPQHRAGDTERQATGQVEIGDVLRAPSENQVGVQQRPQLAEQPGHYPEELTQPLQRAGREIL